jgi:hypothetical protein
MSVWEYIAANPNMFGGIAAAITTGLITYLIMRSSKGTDARSTAEAALIGIGPTIITAQNLRIGALETETGRLWKELVEAQYRERTCLQRLYIIEAKLGIEHDEEGKI